jgi:hypothetical protein
MEESGHKAVLKQPMQPVSRNGICPSIHAVQLRSSNSQQWVETGQSASGHKLPVVSHSLNGCFYPASLTIELTGASASIIC